MPRLVLLLACAALSLACTRSQVPIEVAHATVDRGPTRIALDGDANGLWWDPDDDTLFIADDDGQQILAWSDATGFTTVATLPRASGARPPGLGQLVRMRDGTVVVTRFGHGTSGDVVVVPPSGPPVIVPHLDPARRRIGLTVADDGTLYDAWFVRAGEARTGGVARLSLSDGETVVLEGLGKPVGVLAQGDTLVVADQERDQVLVAPRVNPSRARVWVEGIESPDLLCHGSGDVVFTGGRSGEVRRIEGDGTVSVVASGFREVRGVAFDAEHVRLFVADHDPDDADGLAHAIHIVPIDP